MKYFNSQPHEEADVKVIVSSATRYDISTHSLTKRLTWRARQQQQLPYPISTHSLTKRLTRLCLLMGYVPIISTHSLTKRLTTEISICVPFGVFQLTASRRGWRFSPYHDRPKYSYFNSQPHEEADIYAEFQQSSGIISTHSLTKRLTLIRIGFYKNLTFQLTASRRGWRRCIAISCFP